MAETSVSLAQRSSVQAHAYYVRNSAYKAREVLNLIRGKSCADANDILAFSSRAIAKKINKVLNSAIANAEHNGGLDADELYISACYANEGPTLKRWRPRAQGRASPILKRTCHITVIVSRYDEEQLGNMRERGLTRTPKAKAESRKRRVARSRKAQKTTQAHEAAATATDVGVVASDGESTTSDGDVEQENADVGVVASDGESTASDGDVEQENADSSAITDTATDETGISENSGTSNYAVDADVANDPNSVNSDSTNADNASSTADSDNQDESDSSGQEPDNSSAEKTV